MSSVISILLAAVVISTLTVKCGVVVFLGKMKAKIFKRGEVEDETMGIYRKYSNNTRVTLHGMFQNTRFMHD